MLIKSIQQYAILLVAGNSTLAERLEIPIQHWQSLKRQIAQLQEHTSKLDDKADFYHQAIMGIKHE